MRALLLSFVVLLFLPQSAYAGCGVSDCDFNETHEGPGYAEAGSFDYQGNPDEDATDWGGCSTSLWGSEALESNSAGGSQQAANLSLSTGEVLYTRVEFCVDSGTETFPSIFFKQTANGPNLLMLKLDDHAACDYEVEWTLYHDGSANPGEIGNLCFDTVYRFELMWNRNNNTYEFRYTEEGGSPITISSGPLTGAGAGYQTTRFFWGVEGTRDWQVYMDNLSHDSDGWIGEEDGPGVGPSAALFRRRGR